MIDVPDSFDEVTSWTRLAVPLCYSVPNEPQMEHTQQQDAILQQFSPVSPVRHGTISTSISTPLVTFPLHDTTSTQCRYINNMSNISSGLAQRRAGLSGSTLCCPSWATCWRRPWSPQEPLLSMLSSDKEHALKISSGKTLFLMVIMFLYIHLIWMCLCICVSSCNP